MGGILTEDSSRSARQIVSALERRGSEVLLDAARTPLGRFSRHERAVHSVARVGADRYGWLDAALRVVARVHPAVLGRPTNRPPSSRVRRTSFVAIGVGMAAPSFASLAQMQGKPAATRLLTQVEFDQRVTVYATSPADLRRLRVPPVYLKPEWRRRAAGVLRVSGPADVDAATKRFAGAEGGVLVQEVVDRPLAMVQSVFDRGRLVARHAVLRVREGASRGPAPSAALRTRVRPVTRLAGFCASVSAYRKDHREHSLSLECGLCQTRNCT